MIACRTLFSSLLRSSKDRPEEYETADDIDFMADLERLESERLALAAENERLLKRQVAAVRFSCRIGRSDACAVAHRRKSTKSCVWSL